MVVRQLRKWRTLLPSGLVALMGLLFGLFYRSVADDAGSDTPSNYLRSALHGMCLGLASWATHLWFVSRRRQWLTRWPTTVAVLLRSAAMALAIGIAATGLQALLYPEGVRAAWLSSRFPQIVAIALAASIVASAIFELSRFVGVRVLLGVLAGRYHRPVREDRLLMFLDLAGSTSLAESMGEVRVHDLLTRFFSDIDDPIVEHRGEVHAYIGDAVIVSWRAKQEAPLAQSVGCFFAILDRISNSSEAYLRDFGVIPRFRAALHSGPVVISECGESHRQLSFFGDTVNVCARLLEYAKEVGGDLVASRAAVQLGQLPVMYGASPFRSVEIRGRSAPLEACDICRIAG